MAEQSRSGTASAHPERLRRYAKRAIRVDTELDDQARKLADAFVGWYTAPNDAYAQAFVAGDVPAPDECRRAPSGAVVRRLARLARRWWRLDGTVLRVAAAFDSVSAGRPTGRGLVEAEADVVRRMYTTVGADEHEGELQIVPADGFGTWLQAWLTFYRDGRPTWELPRYRPELARTASAEPVPVVPERRSVASLYPGDQVTFPPATPGRWPAFDFDAAERLAARLRASAAAAADHQGDRPLWRAAELDCWQGDFRERFDRQHERFLPTGGDVIERLRRNAGAVDDVIEAARGVEYLWAGPATPPSPLPLPTPLPTPVPAPDPPVTEEPAPEPPVTTPPVTEPTPPATQPPTIEGHPAEPVPVVTGPSPAYHGGVGSTAEPVPVGAVARSVEPAPALYDSASGINTNRALADERAPDTSAPDTSDTATGIDTVPPPADEPAPAEDGASDDGGDDGGDDQPIVDGETVRAAAGPVLAGAGIVGATAYMLRRTDDDKDEEDPLTRLHAGRRSS